jgi:RNA polymerase sigma-70 factor (ECF subfamily)
MITALDDLLKKVIMNDDEKAFERIFFDFFAPLCLFASRYLDKREDCEDIVQNVFFNLWEHRKKLVILSSGRNFLITNVKNACIDLLRKRYTEESYREKESLKDESDPLDTYSLYAVSELKEQVDAALALLPVNVRRSFEMNRFDGKTYNEIADECNISVKTVEAHISKALRLLRNELKDYTYFSALFL